MVYNVSPVDSDVDEELDMMTTQAFVTDLQAMNPTVVQVHQVNHTTAKSPVTSQSSQAQKAQTTVVQPAQAHSGHSGQQQQQYIVTTSVGDVASEHPPGQETVTIQPGGQATFYPAHVQYVDGNDPNIYASTNGQMYIGTDMNDTESLKEDNSDLEVLFTNHFLQSSEKKEKLKALNRPGYQTEYGQTTLYTPASGTYYQTTGGAQGVAGLPNVGTIQTVQGHILTQQSGTYLIQGGTMDGEGTPLTHTTRASPATQTIAARSYYENPQESHASPVNLDAPSLKEGVQWLIDNYETAEGVSLPRSTLYNHYLRHCQEQNLDPMNPASFGKLIRSVFLGLRTRRLGTRGNSKYHYYGIRIKANSPLNQFTDDQTMAMRQQPMYQGKKFRPKLEGGDGSDGNPGTPAHGGHEGPTTQQQQHQQFLGDASGAIPNFGDVDTGSEPLPEGVTADHVKTFEKMYREHAEAIVDVVVNLQFSLIEALWQGFWRNQPLEQQSPDNDYERRLPRDKLYAMCKYSPVQQYVRRSDYAFYQALVEVLIPDVLRPIPSSLTQAIRNFAKSLENWLKGSMTGVPDEMMKTKIGAVSAFAQTLRRYTSLNHLAQAARAVLQNTSQINQMLTDLNRVDFANVQEQASWVCQCDEVVVQQLEQDFKKTLQQQNSLEQWAVWLEGVVNQVLKPHEDSPNFPKAARQFLLKWSFYSSMVIRDLTLRSAASFGSFHLIRLLYDEYMFYLVEHKVAAATGETPIAVMGEFIDLSSAVAMSTLDTEMKLSAPSKTSTVSAATAGTSLISKPSEGVYGSGTVATGAAGPSAATAGTSLISKANDGISMTGAAVSRAGTGTGGATLMVLASNSGVTAGTHNGTISVVTAAPNTNTTTLTVKTASTTGSIGGAKTIVVMPVSSALAGGDGQATKRFKLE